MDRNDDAAHVNATKADKCTQLLSKISLRHGIKSSKFASTIGFQLLTHFRRGLYESAAKVKGWIVTDGFNSGCISEVGRARKLYSTAHNGNVEIIALANFEELYPPLKKRLLNGQDKEIIISPFHTNSDGNDSDTSAMIELDNGSSHRILESNHSKYLLIRAPGGAESMRTTMPIVHTKMICSWQWVP